MFNSINKISLLQTLMLDLLWIKNSYCHQKDLLRTTIEVYSNKNSCSLRNCIENSSRKPELFPYWRWQGLCCTPNSHSPLKFYFLFWYWEPSMDNIKLVKNAYQMSKKRILVKYLINSGGMFIYMFFLLLLIVKMWYLL